MVVATIAPSVVTGWAALVGLLDAGSVFPCSKPCPGGPDVSSEAWWVGAVYVGVLVLLSFERVFPDGAGKDRSSRGKHLLMYVTVSVGLAVIPPRLWEPLRPAFVTGALSAAVIALVGHRLAARLTTGA